MRGFPVPRAALAALERYNPEAGACQVDVSDNTNLWGPSPAAERAVRLVSAHSISRYPPVDPSALCAALADYAGVTPEQVVTGCGSDDVIDCALRAFADPGETVAFCVPTFSMLPNFARVNGLRPRRALPPRRRPRRGRAARGKGPHYLRRLSQQPDRPRSLCPGAGEAPRLGRGPGAGGRGVR